MLNKAGILSVFIRFLHLYAKIAMLILSFLIKTTYKCHFHYTALFFKKSMSM